MSAKIDKETNIGYNKMNCADLVRARMKDTGTALHKLAEKMGYSRQRLGNRLLRNSLTAEEFCEAMAIMGATVKIEKNDGQQNLLWERTPSVGPPICKMCNGYVCDTEKADSLAASFTCRKYPEGIQNHFAWELYQDRSGFYFVVVYSDIPSCPTNVYTVTPEEAEWYLEHNIL